MKVPDEARRWTPRGGVWRIHPDPVRLPSRPGHREPSPNRFDDPLGQYRVRYLSTTRRGAFLEVLCVFRRNDEARKRLIGVTNVTDDGCFEESQVPVDYLQQLKSGRFHVDESCWFADVAAVRLQTILGQQESVREAIDAADLGDFKRPAQLDEALIRLSGPRGRLITQAVSRVIFEKTEAAGIRYTSRIDIAEECWAVFESTSVSWASPMPIILDDPDLIPAAEVLGLAFS